MKVQKRIASLLMQIEPPSYLYCPVRGRSQFQNATVHSGARAVVTLDIRSFFASTNESRAIWFFRTYLGCSIDIAVILTKLVCFEGHLPTGAPTSPILAHYIYRDMWDAIDQACRQANVKLSVWIDDITMSGARVPGELIWQVKRELSRYALRYHKPRTTLSKPARVTGVILQPNGSISLPHRHHHKVHSLKSEAEQAEFRADARTLIRVQEKLVGLKGQEVQLRVTAAAIGVTAQERREKSRQRRRDH
jgi:hypothetical protein